LDAALKNPNRSRKRMDGIVSIVGGFLLVLD